MPNIEVMLRLREHWLFFVAGPVSILESTAMTRSYDKWKATQLGIVVQEGPPSSVSDRQLTCPSGLPLKDFRIKRQGLLVAEHITIGGLGATPVGTAKHVADTMEKWVEDADVDGFNLVSLEMQRLWLDVSSLMIWQAYALFPSSFEDIINLLLPELRSRGLFWSEYAVPQGTYRENLYQRGGQRGPPEEHVASSYRWKAGIARSEHIIPGS